jgi:hypothetical protein
MPDAGLFLWEGRRFLLRALATGALDERFRKALN